MDVYTNSSGLQHVVGYGPHSVVVAHHNHNHHDGHHNHYHTLPPRPVPKAASCYQLVPVIPVAPTTIYVPVQTQQKNHQHHYQRQAQGNCLKYIYIFIYLFL